MRRAAFLLVAGLGLLCGSPPVQAQPFSYAGYAKTLGLVGQSLFSGDRYVLDLTRLRTTGRWSPTANVTGEVWLDTELWIGDFLQTPEYTLSRALPRATWLALDWTLTDGTHHWLRQHLFRAFVTAYGPGEIRLTAGRHRIAWGTGFVWNPTDLLNPIDPAGIERAEQGGVDALSIAVPMGALSQIEGVVALGRNPAQHSYAVRAGTHVGEYDISGMGGHFRGDWVWGADWAGYVGNAGFRGEWAYTRRSEGADFVRGIANIDYTFANGVYLLIEGFYNGLVAAPAVLDARSRVLFYAGRWYGALSAAKALTPLVTMQGYGIANLSDGSGLAGPGLVWSLAENLELAATAFLFFGPQGAEYGALQNVYFASLQFYF